MVSINIRWVPRLQLGHAQQALCMALAGLWAICIPQAHAQQPGESPPSKPRAILSTREAGTDYFLQGEYSGTLQAAGLSGPAGLQVVALGRGEFSARLYAGGLPGDGWLRSPPWKFSGPRNGSRIPFAGHGVTLEVSLDNAVMRGTNGRQLGILTKRFRRSPTLGLPPPPGARVLFESPTASGLEGAQVDRQGLLREGAITQMPVGDFQLHLEFLLPFMPEARGQDRGNSGVYVQRRYEVQILDSFGLAGEANECGSFYRQRPPDENMCLPPLVWQTYDITFTAAQFVEGQKISPARMTVMHNGVAVHSQVALTGKTGAGQAEGPAPGPILLQDHGNPVRFRNYWLLEGAGQSSDFQQVANPGSVSFAQ